MSKDDLTSFAIIISSIWLGFFIFIWLMLLDADVRKPWVIRWNLLFKKKKIKVRKFCTSHVKLGYHKGLILVHDTECELCIKKKLTVL